jgi:hypothetical protein
MPEKRPWHLWVVGVLSLLWNASGAYTIMSAQAGKLPGITADEAAYYAAQAPWFVAVTDIALLSAFTAAIALLLRSRWAVPLYVLSIVCIAVTAGYDLAAGTSRMFANSGALIATVLIWILAVLQWWYAAAMRAKGVLS